MKLYPYVGPKAIAERGKGSLPGLPIDSPRAVVQWVRQTGQELNRQGCVTVTFVIDAAGMLRVAERRSEHVACAGGDPVQSAGEMTFQVSPVTAGVVSVTNQSTGYCPEPDSWPAVRAALDRAGIAYPEGFTRAVLFRRCENCGSINVVKDDHFECGVCSAALATTWNLAAAAGD